MKQGQEAEENQGANRDSSDPEQNGVSSKEIKIQKKKKKNKNAGDSEQENDGEQSTPPSVTEGNFSA